MLRKLGSLYSDIQMFRSMPYTIRDVLHTLKWHQADSLRESQERLKSNPRYDDPRNLIRYGYKVYSQGEEDGMLREIFTRIGVTNRVFVEFGVGNGLENNTLALMFDGWNGLWIEGSEHCTQSIRKNFKNVIDTGMLAVIGSFITKDNIDELISSKMHGREIDLLSIDIDGNDYHVLDAISCIAPRVLVIEYNAKFPPPILFCMDYDPSHTWQGDDCLGASLKFLEINIARKGYCLVGCSLSGVNAFFVRHDLVAEKFLEPFSAENHYQPARYYLNTVSSGHAASYDALSRSLTMLTASSVAQSSKLEAPARSAAVGPRTEHFSHDRSAAQ
jgi:hypothetical protein